MHFVMFSIDITLFYLIPLVLSVVLYTLISIMLLFNAPRTFNDGTSRNRARLQVGDCEARTEDDRSGGFCQEISISFNLNLALLELPAACTSKIFSWQVVKMLIIVVAIFAILWLPHRGMLVYNTLAAYYHYPKYMDLWFLMFAKTCIYINRSLNLRMNYIHFHFV